MPMFRVTRTDTYTNVIEAESAEALEAILNSGDDTAEAFTDIDESLDWEESSYEVEEEER